MHPAFSGSRVRSFQAVLPGGPLAPADPETSLDGAVLYGRDGAGRGNVRIEAVFAGAQQTIDLLARGERSGFPGMGQRLAASVRPDDPRVAALLRAASDAPAGQGLAPGSDGSRIDGPARASTMAAAFRSASEALGPRDAAPGAASEAAGETIRPPQGCRRIALRPASSPRR